MSKQYVRNLPFPIGGVVKRHAITNQGPLTTSSAMNVWPTDWTEGRERGGTRPGLNLVTETMTGLPRHGFSTAWTNGTTASRGIIVTTANGVYSATTGAFTSRISKTIGAFSSAAMLQNVVYLANESSTKIEYYDFGSGAQNDITASAGTVPGNCGCACAYGNRLFVGGRAQSPHVLYASKIGDVTNWDYAEVTADAAFASNVGTGNGVGSAITALITHTEDCMIIGMLDSTVVMLGNPTTGGAMKTVSHNVGPLEQSACCHGPNGVFYCMTRDGLYSMPYGCGGALSQESRNALPLELMAIDPATSKTSIAYDLTWMGIHVSVSGRNVHYFFDVQTGGWWPMAFSDVTPYLNVSFPAAATQDKSGMYAIESGAGCLQYDRLNGDQEDVDSYLSLGPFPVGNDGQSGQVMQVDGTLSEASGDIGLELYMGDSATQCLDALETGSSPTWTGRAWDVNGLNKPQKPRCNGVYGALKIVDVNYARWSFEKAGVITSPRSRERIVYG